MFIEGLRGFYEKENQISPEKLFGQEYKLVPVRVLDIILDETHPNFNRYGGWNGIGTIEYENVTGNKLVPSNNPIAIPLNSSIKDYPLVNEIVLLFLLPSKNLNNEQNSQTLYYLTSINLWNHPHHNAFPDVIRYEYLKNNQKNDYKDIEGGSVRRVKDKSTEIELNSPKTGGTFVEKTNIHPLLPFPGDRIYEGRFGNSIRFGNTSKSQSKAYKNNWSGAGNNGDPITIFRNGQPLESNEEGWKPILEDINKDLTSLYMTSNQIIPLNNLKENYRAFNKIPIQINSYSDPQGIFNSSRIVINAYGDYVLIQGKKGISLSTEGEVGISTKRSVNVDSPNIKLGSKKAEEAPILGDSFMTQFGELLLAIKSISKALQKLKDWPQGTPVPNVIIPAMASNLEEVTDEILKLVKDKKRPLLSQKVNIE